MSRELARTALLGAILIFCSAAIGLALIVAADLLPADIVKRNVLTSVGKKNSALHPVFPGAKLDLHTECVSLTAGMRSKSTGDRSDYSVPRAVLDAITSPTLGDCRSIASNTGFHEYFRYWHGAQIVHKPILLLSGVHTVRAVVFVAFAVSFLFLLWMLGTQINWLTAGIVGLLIAIAPLYSQLFIVPHASCWIIGFTCAGLILRNQPMPFRTLCLLFVLIGILGAYFDLLNNPVVAPVAALLAVTLARWRDGKDADFREVALLGLFWLFGYAGFWTVKWLLAVPFLGAERVSHDILAQIARRVAGEDRYVETSVWNSLSLNLSLMLHVLTAAVALSACIFALRVWPQRPRLATASTRLAMQTLAVGLIPVLWLVVLRNHSAVHPFFVAPILTWTMISLPVAVQIARWRTGVEKADRAGRDMGGMRAAERPAPRRQIARERNLSP